MKLPDRGVCIAKLGAHSALLLTTPQPGSRDVRLPATMRNNTRKLYFLGSCLAQTKARGIIDGYEQKKKSNRREIAGSDSTFPFPSPRPDHASRFLFIFPSITIYCLTGYVIPPGA